MFRATVQDAPISRMQTTVGYFHSNQQRKVIARSMNSVCEA